LNTPAASHFSSPWQLHTSTRVWVRGEEAFGPTIEGATRRNLHRGGVTHCGMVKLVLKYCHVLLNGEAGFEVRDKKWRFTVDLNNRTCSCRYWQVSEIPCAHACAALFKMSEEPNKYVHMCFSLEAYKRTYQHVLQPIEHESAWPVSQNPKPLPLRVKKMPGRPKKNRRKDPSEPKRSSTKSSRVGTKIKCGRCKGDGHNSRTCTVTMVFILLLSCYLFADFRCANFWCVTAGRLGVTQSFTAACHQCNKAGKYQSIGNGTCTIQAT